MIKSASVKKFLDDNRYVIHSNLRVKDRGSYAQPPYIAEYNLSIEELLEKVLYALSFSKETEALPNDWPKDQKDYFKGMGVKNMKGLHENSLSLSLYVRDGVLTFVPYENKGFKGGFAGYKEDMDVKVSFNASKEELVKALELALSRCK